MEALIIPDMAGGKDGKVGGRDPYVVSFKSHPGYDLESILQKLKIN